MKTSTALSAFASLLFAAVSVFGQGAPDCAWTDIFGAAVAGTSHNNTSAGNSPCVAYRVTYDAVGMTAISLQLEGAPWNSGGTGPGTFVAISGSAIVQGANPLTSATNATLATTGTVYYPFVRIHVTTFTPTGSSGTITVRTYGYKGTSAANPAGGGGSGTVTGGPFTSGNVIEGGGGQAIADTGVAFSTLIVDPMTALGDMIYENGTPAPARLPGNTTATLEYLTQQGNGTISAVPQWNPLPTTLIAQKFFGTAAPGSVSGNLPGDLFTDTVAHNEYVCNAPAGTAAPACTSVTAAGWLLLNTAAYTLPTATNLILGGVTMSTATSSVAVATDDPRNSNARLPSAGTVLVAQKFFGTASPGSVATNLPGDFYTDTTADNEYVCGAPAGTAAPACTSVTAAGWMLQTQAAIVPNTAPASGQLLIGNAGGTAYAPLSLSQDCTLASTGVITCAKSNNVAFGTAAFVNTGSSGATIPLLNTATNTWSGVQLFSAGSSTAPSIAYSSYTGTGISFSQYSTNFAFDGFGFGASIGFSVSIKPGNAFGWSTSPGATGQNTTIGNPSVGIVTFGGTSATNAILKLGALQAGSAPTASNCTNSAGLPIFLGGLANCGTLSVGGGPFDGTTTGKFVGSTSGTSIAVNEVSAYAGNLFDFQVAGVSQAKLSDAGLLTLAGSTFVLGGHTCSIVSTVLTCP
jgi:hypothetical protein